MIDPVVSGSGGLLTLLIYTTDSTLHLIPFESSYNSTLAMVCGCEKFERSYSFRNDSSMGEYLVRGKARSLTFGLFAADQPIVDYKPGKVC